ncbi:MAG: methyltransferase RsmF C-terminal domain-like protein [candidate division WOR-3 bacterium]
MKEIKRPLSERFGIPDEFWKGLLISIQGKQAWISTPEASEIVGPVLRRGIRFSHKTSDGWKLSAEGAMAIGRVATRCVLDLDEQGIARFLSGYNIEGDFAWEDGQVIIRWNGFPVGVGLLRGRVIKNQLRASRRLPPSKR